MADWLKELLEEMRDDIKEIKADVKAQNGRIRNLEIWRGKILGISAVIALVASLLIKYVL